MTPEQFKRAESLFTEARSLAPEERSAFLSRACADDAQLLGRVERMILRASQPAEEIPSRARTSLLGGLAEILTEHAGAGEEIRQIGSYKVIRKIGEGGMGVVYEAAQENPRRTVALKVVRPGLGGGNLLRRFKKEAELLGQLQHPGIACIYEAGVGEVRTDGGAVVRKQPYFAMEYVRGEPLSQYVRRCDLGVRARMELVARIAEAVQHAHENGVIHRDLKPANILIVDSGRDRKEANGARAADRSGSFRGSDTHLQQDVQPKILDFGIARTTNADIQAVTLQTDVGQLVGTVPYMSPEQVAGDSRQLDARTDVYSLGVILYEMLAGKLPLDVRNRSIPEAARIIREDDPSRLSSIDTRFRGDVETIVAKALEKDKQRRYASAANFTADIRRYLRDEPVQARPASAMYQWTKFARRHRGLVAGIAMTIVALCVGLAGTLIMAVRERHQRQVAERANVRSELEAYRANLAAASAAIRLDDGSAAKRRLDAVPMARRGWEWKHLNWLADRSDVTLVGHKSPPWRNRFLSTPGQFASVSDDGDFRIWDIATAKCVRQAHIPVTGLISPDGAYLLAHKGTRCEIWDTQTSKKVFEVTGNIRTMDPFSPNGKLAYLGSEGAIIGAYELASGCCLRTMPAPDLCERLKVSSDGTKLLYDGAGRMGVIDVNSGMLWQVSGANAHFTDTGNIFARNEQLQYAILDVLTGRTIRTLDYFHGDPAQGTHSEDIQLGSMPLSVFHRRREKSEKVPITLNVHVPHIDAASHRWAAMDGCTIKIGDTRMVSAPLSVTGGQFAPTHVFDTQGTRVAALGWGEATLRDTITGAELWSRFVSLYHLDGGAFSPDGTRLTTIDGKGELSLLSTDTGKTIRRQLLPSPSVALAYSPDGSSIAIAGLDGVVRLLNPATGQQIREWRAAEGPIRCLAFSPEGRRILTGSAKGRIYLPRREIDPPQSSPHTRVAMWDSGSGTQVSEYYAGDEDILSVAFAQDGNMLAWLCANGAGTILAAAAERQSFQCPVQPGAWDAAMAFNFDASRLAIGVQSGILIIDPRTGEDLAILNPGVQEQYVRLAWRGETLMSAGWHMPLVSYETQPPDCDANERYVASITNALVGPISNDVSKRIADLDQRKDLPDEIRKAALKMARARDPHPKYLASEAWAILRGSDRTKEDYAEALRLMEIACSVRPAAAGLQRGLGVAQFRACRWTDALASFAASDQRPPAPATSNGIDKSPDADVQLMSAMCHWHLGDKDLAVEEMRRGQALANSPEYKTNPMVQTLLREATQLFAAGGKALQ